MYVNGLRKDMGQAMAAFDRTKTMAPPPLCAKCGCDDESMIEVVSDGTRDPGLGVRGSGFGTQNDRIPDPGSRIPVRNGTTATFCSHEWTVELRPAGRFTSIEGRRAANRPASRRVDDARGYRCAQYVLPMSAEARYGKSSVQCGPLVNCSRATTPTLKAQLPTPRTRDQRPHPRTMLGVARATVEGQRPESARIPDPGSRIPSPLRAMDAPSGYKQITPAWA
jgi:hypothetical protein